ncbi:MAG: elongation factor G [Pirellulales bacterium]
MALLNWSSVMARNLQNLRNIGIIAHIDAGKTTLTERMLYYSGAIHRMGDVDKGTTTTDFDPEERERGITIYSAAVTFDWRGTNINLIDTPGHVDFTAEVERSLRVLDGGVVVFSAREGVEAQSETVWRQADKYGVPRIAFINKMDREGADFFGTLKEIRVRLESLVPVAVQIPVGAGPPHVSNCFRGIVDLVAMKLLLFPKDKQGAELVQEEIPADLLDEAKIWRDEMLEQLFEYSNEIGELYLAGEAVPEELVRKVLRQATVHRMIVPVYCGSALDYVGVQPLLDGVAAYLPAPADVPAVEGVNPKKPDVPEKRSPTVDEPFCGLVFKIQAGRHGELHFVRVYSGKLKANSRAFNPGKDKKENVAQLWRIQADRREEQVDVVNAGDIAGVIGLRASVTGDTLCDAQHPILLETIVFPDTVISMAIEPETSADRKKLADTLEMLKRQDPTFRAQESEETGQTIISGMGELHLEVIKHRLLRDFNLNVKVHNPRVSYRESVAQAVEVTGECNRQLAGQQLWARVKIRMEPHEGDQRLRIAPTAAAQLPPAYLTSATEILTQMVEGGGTLGHPLTKVLVTVLGGEVHELESNELAFRIAAHDAFERALKAAGPVLLEPIMKLEIITPEENMGDFVADLQKRRGLIQLTSNRGRNTVIDAQVPLAKLFGYSGDMRSLSQGRATCSMEPCGFAAAPAEDMQRFM